MSTPDNMVFVFGSNLKGLHGAGAAKFAYRNRGAEMGVALGHRGNSFAIPTKDETIKNTLPLFKINAFVDTFLAYAKRSPDLNFQITRIGCGLAGLRDEDIAPMFKNHSPNCWFDLRWVTWLGSPSRTEVKYWGTF